MSDITEHMTIFEQVSNIVNGGKNAGDLNENCIYWCDGDKFATVNVGYSSRYATRLRKLAESEPDDVKIFSDNKGGYLVATIPVKAVKINIVHRNFSDEHKKKLAERLGKIHRSSKTSLV